MDKFPQHKTKDVLKYLSQPSIFDNSPNDIIKQKEYWKKKDEFISTDRVLNTEYLDYLRKKFEENALDHFNYNTNTMKVPDKLIV